MVAAHIRIAPLTSADAIDPAELRDLLYLHTLAGSGVEHLRVRAGPHGADILAFVDTDDPERAAHVLRHIVDTTIANTPLLAPWRVL